MSPSNQPSRSPAGQEGISQNSVQETPAMVALAVRQLRDAIALMPGDECNAYRKALETCPELLASESNPVRFLRCCNYNIWAAARRMASYWELRAEVFGEERCYKPVSLLNESGALSQIAQSVVEIGVAYLLPHDMLGRDVLYFTRANFSAKVRDSLGVAIKDKIEASFYHLHTVALQPGSATKGFVFLQIITEKQPKVNPQLQAFFSRANRDCFPIKMQGLHIVCAPQLNPQVKKSRFADKFLPFLWQLLQRPFNFTKRSVDLVMVETAQGAGKKSLQADVARVLITKFGLNPDGLPPEAGGSWSYARYKSWYKQQREEAGPAEMAALVELGSGTGSRSAIVAPQTVNQKSPTPVPLSPLELLANAASGAKGGEELSPTRAFEGRARKRARQDPT